MSESDRASDPGAEIEDIADHRWLRSIVYNKDRTYTKVASNAVLLLTHHRAWRGCLRYNAFSDRVLWCRKGPDAHGFDPPAPECEFEDHQHHYIANWLARETGMKFDRGTIVDVALTAARASSFNPWVEYLLSCRAKWDGVARLDEWLCTYLGAPRLPVNLRIGPMWLIGAAARGIKPGCKMDYILVLEGDQGVGKNQALEALFGDDVFLPQLAAFADKDAMAGLVGIACACIDELSAKRAQDEEAFKSFLSRRFDRYRPHYGRTFVRRYRTTVFAATTNVEEYLLDPTGNRRTWPCACGAIDLAALRRDRDQLWGEAVARFQDGEQWWPDQSENLALREIQSAREQGDEWDARIARFANGREWVTVGECLSDLGLEMKDWRPVDQHRVARALRRAGWRSYRTDKPKDGRPARYWLPRPTS